MEQTIDQSTVADGEGQSQSPAQASGIPVWCAHDEIVDLTTLVPNPRNPNKHGDKQIALLAKIIRHQGWRNPIVVSTRSGFITKGHGRLQAAKLLMVESVPIDRQDYANDADEWADMIADNRIAELAKVNKSILSEVMLEMDTGAFDMELTGYDLGAIEDLMTASAPDDTFAGTSEELPGAHALKADMVFKSMEPYDIPMLLADKLGTVPEPITCWASPDASSLTEFYFYNVNTDSVRGLDFRKSILGFYTDDYRFEEAWLMPDAFTAKVINRAPLAIVHPNYSCVEGSPMATHIWNVYRSRWVGRYMQEAGLTVIPDFQYIDNKGQPADYCLAGIPKNAPCIAIQQHTSVKDSIDKDLNVRELQVCVDVLKPQSLFIYHGSKGHEVVEKANLPKSLRIVMCESRLLVRGPVMRKKK